MAVWLPTCVHMYTSNPLNHIITYILYYHTHITMSLPVTRFRAKDEVSGWRRAGRQHEQKKIIPEALTRFVKEEPPCEKAVRVTVHIQIVGTSVPLNKR